MENHYGSSLWKFFVEVLYGSSLWKFFAEILCGSSLWKIFTEILCGSSFSKFFAEILCRNSLQKIFVEILWVFALVITAVFRHCEILLNWKSRFPSYLSDYRKLTFPLIATAKSRRTLLLMRSPKHSQNPLFLR